MFPGLLNSRVTGEKNLRSEAVLSFKVQACTLHHIQCLCNFKDLIAQFFLIRYVEEEIVQLRSRFYQIALSPAKQNKRKKYKKFKLSVILPPIK